ncbi:sensor histidine kinase [Balneatrix alpica]|uniref:sensor histidine kinase n=1 Tax=Balneatrix alpica TaxID=75684 RepID=UPI0027394CAA|nr:HAMP domain-containing sensor histidine kinase [Balneatrix alpica]
MSDSQLDVRLVLAGTVHESKNRLIHMQQLLEQLRAHPASQDGALASALASLEQDVRKVNHDLVRMLQLYRLHAHNYTLQPDSHMLLEFLEDQLFFFQPMLDTKDLHISIDADDELVAWFDATLMELTLSTILFNALDFAFKQIQIRAWATEGYVCIRISDDGQGFSEQSQERHGIDAELHTGLGLTFARSVMAQHEAAGRLGEVVTGRDDTLGGAFVELRLPA